LTCRDPGNVEHSRKVITGTRFNVGSTVQFICNKGYVLSGSSLLTCYNRDSAVPKWSDRLPKCVSEKYEPCRNPGAPSTSIQSSEKAFYQAGETLTFSCHAGYELRGGATMYCVPGHPFQGKSIRMPTSSPPYDNMTEESAFDNPIYESGVSTDVMSMQDVDSQNTSVLS
ncbi:hypothetical protein XENOCAPTIV_024784, partial [Xenoophorus captivus]